jgi:hypothetical protein
MGIFDRFNFNKQETIGSPKMPVQTGREEFGSMSFSMETDLPVIKEVRNKDWVEYGYDNLYPQYLQQLFNTSPTHQAIVKTKSLMIVGDGYSIESDHLDEKAKMEVAQLINQINNQMYETTLDQQLYGAFAYEIIWSLDFKRIIKVNRVDPATLRSGKYKENFVDCWYYSRDWSNRQEEIKEIYSFEESDGENFRQLLYVPCQTVSNEYYGEPSYLAGIDWINLEASTGLYYKSLIENGFNPSILVKFYRKPKNKEERDSIVNGLKKSYGGVKNSGKAMVVFSDGKELAPDIEPIANQNVDKQFTVIADQITTKILTAGRVTTPEMFGIAVPGQLGTGDFGVKVAAFNAFVVKPEQRVIENTVNRILLANGYDVNYRITPLTFDIPQK